MVEEGQQYQEWEWQYYRWKQHEEGPVTDSNPLFDDEDREKWAVMSGKRKSHKPSEKVRQSGLVDPKDFAMFEKMRNNDNYDWPHHLA